ncbi:MAG TPA: VWA domain-containing protein [Blastocatellia bacterium]|jgi:VWFA-related protein|nr:VWA domain-containing protein [Blastocatellia bacterium]
MNEQSNTNRSWKLKLAVAVALTLAAAFIANSFLVTDQTFAQAGRKSSDKQKKNPNASGDADDPQKQQTKVEKSLPPSSINISTDVVNVEAVVYNKKTGGVIQGLKKEHFEIYEDGIKQEVENFSTPEAPVTMVLLLEYSKLIDVLGSGTGGMFEYGRVEVLRPAYEFVNRFVQPKDFISIVAYDIRPTPLVDFTDDKMKLMQAINLLIRNNPAFSESNMFDALKFVLRGGKGDAVVLEDGKDADKNNQSDYAGLYEVNSRTAILLIASGLDTFSKINFDEARKIVENSGVPIYVLGTGNLFMKKYDQYMDPGRGGNIYGIPFDRMTMLQAQNTLKTFCDSTGGKYIPITFPGEIPAALQTIQALVRNEYSLGYTPTNSRREGKRRKIQVKVNLGDQIDPKLIVIQHRQSYVEPKDKK